MARPTLVAATVAAILAGAPSWPTISGTTRALSVARMSSIARHDLDAVALFALVR
ncbi:hypothetical protein [Nannocystis exedens]|uniref:hypothetical protein n=1 Tax=Nannocystis exedens TaxID=54 RepID=UPI001472F712|nr:hypothetical protein [Nannocystis exedens]